MTASHYHVHSYIPGYVCECDEHYPYRTLAAARDALREERDFWRDYAADAPADDPIRASGSIRAGRFDYQAGMSWWRAAELWECSEDCTTEDN